jgi:hypothetical protein
VNEVPDAGRQRGVAGRVIAVIGSDDDVRDGLVGDPANRLDQPRVAATLPCASARSTPSRVMTIRSVVVNFSAPA